MYMAGATPRCRLGSALPTHVVNSVSGIDDTPPDDDDGKLDAVDAMRLLEVTRPANTTHTHA